MIVVKVKPVQKCAEIHIICMKFSYIAVIIISYNFKLFDLVGIAFAVFGRYLV